MRVLYIDTSTSYLYAGIVNNDHIDSEIKEELGCNLSRDALPLIAEMFDKCHMNPRDIDKIIVVNGPGSFTGIRVGLTIAKVYAWTLNIPITSILSLEAMACINDKTVKVPIVDALKGNVYAAIYNGDKEILKPCHISIDKLKERLKEIENYTVISKNKYDIGGNLCEYDPDILSIVKKYVEKSNISSHLVNPEYLKLSSAEEAKRN